MTFIKQVIRCFFSVCVMICSTFYCYGATPLNIISDSLTISKNNQTAIFDGGVIAFFDNIKLLSTKLIIYYDAENTKQKQIKKIIIPQMVKAIKMDTNEIIVADKAEYDNETKKLILIGNVQIQKENNIISADRLIYSAKLNHINKNTLHEK